MSDQKIAEEERALAPNHEPIVGRPGFTQAYRGVPLNPPARFEKGWSAHAPGKGEALTFYDDTPGWRSRYKRVGDEYILQEERDGVLRDAHS
jgi:hypothetical protein